WGGRVRGSIGVAAGLALAIAAGGAAPAGGSRPRGEAPRDSPQQAPGPAPPPRAPIPIYPARPGGRGGGPRRPPRVRLEPRGASAYSRYEVIGWGVERGLPAVRVDRAGPDDYWFGSRPTLLVDRRGDGVDELIEKVQQAIASYPYPDSYRLWPGPNSNTFTAHVGRAVPELRLDLPPTAIGKDFLPGAALVATPPGGRGIQISVLGMAGILAGWEEGLEVNVLGLTFG